MVHLKKTQPWGCLATAFAMAYDMTLEEFYDYIEHDGAQIVFPELDDPMCRRGTHPNEAVLVGLLRGFTVTPFEVHSQLVSTDLKERFELPPNWYQFTRFIRTRSGVLEGWAGKCKHATAFDHGIIYDPDGPQYPYNRAECERRGFFGNRLWIVDKVAQN
jgi:hypothetical protein